ncbi:MAG: Gfo/Idh/MocA family oxidoreductase [Candidatus Sedimenticola sp. (ex Thyasira tokunagai)]
MNVALVGMGDHMYEHLLPAIRLIYGIRVVGCVTRTSEKQKKIGLLDDSIRVFSEIDELLKEGPSIDLVICSGPPEFQSVVIRKCLRFDSHVFVEKPTCIDHRELEGLQKEAEGKGLLIFTGYNFLYSGVYKQYKKIVGCQDRLHEEINFYSNKPAMPMWGLNSVEESFVYAVGIHAVSLAYDRLNRELIINGVEVASGNGFFSTFHLGNGVDDIHLKFTNSYPFFYWGMDYLSSTGKVVRTEGANRISVLEKKEGDAFSEACEIRSYPGLKLNANNVGYLDELEAMFGIVRMNDVDSVRDVHQRDLSILKACCEMAEGLKQ